ncbi:MAG: hypothetical protein JSU81_04825 [Candidatus Coatesbacteria bacterium]|nr:MAG: hypothetical protein JSU81_04825 [Candidatus Coatesbacteria bacterium]
MRTLLVVMAALALSVAFVGCQKKVEEETAETAAPAMTVEEIKGNLKTSLVEIEGLRAGAEEPSEELAAAFNDHAAKLEDLHGEVAAIEAPEAEATAYEEAAAKIALAVEGTKALATLTEMALAEGEPEMTEEEIMQFSEDAKAKWLEAVEYAAPELLAPEEPVEEETTE